MIDILLIALGIIFLMVGLAGCFLPVLPGPPLSFAALLLLHFTKKYEFSSEFLILWAAITLVVSVLDYVIPIWGTKKFGGSKKAIWGSSIGLVFGLFLFPPWGILILPFVGAILGELMEGKDANTAIKSGFGAFVGLMGGIILKLIASGMMLFYFFAEIVKQSI
jgi:uncharacterized protein